MTQQDLETIPTAQLLTELERRVETIRAEISPLSEDIILIIRAICTHFGVTETQLFSDTRVQPIAWARMAAMTCINCAGHTQQATAAVFRMDHTSVSYARQKVQNLRLTDRIFRQRFTDALNAISREDRHIDLTPPPMLTPG